MTQRDDAGRATEKLIEDFYYWSQIMKAEGFWVPTMGIEKARMIADSIAFDPTLVGKFRREPGGVKPCDQRRVVCMKALFPTSYAEDPFAGQEEAETQEEALKRFARTSIRTMPTTMAFDTADMSSPAMTEPPELFQAEVRRIAEKKGVAIDVDSEFFAEANQ